jgi:hypothetical protein
VREGVGNLGSPAVSRRGAVLATVVCLIVAGCATSAPPPHRAAGGAIASTPPTAARPLPSTTGRSNLSTTTSPSSTATVWLCRPGLVDDPCTANLDVTTVNADGATTIHRYQPAVDPPVDCFYIYPTVSTQPTVNANLDVEPAEIAAAVAQASQFSRICNVWAPIYAQRTEQSLRAGLGADPQADQVAYASLLSGWEDYLTNDNHGRPIVFIGHSQGAAMLILLLHNVIDPSPSLRRLLVSAIVLGGNVSVPTGRDVGGAFQHIPACRSAGQTGCVIAYSSFAEAPPADTLFGIPGQGVSLQSGQTQRSGLDVLCTNPAALGGGAGILDPLFPTSGSPVKRSTITTPWVEFPGLYRASCDTAAGATWLQVTSTKQVGDPRPVVRQTLGPTWGLHLDDVNLGLGDLIQIVAQQETAFERGA